MRTRLNHCNGKRRRSYRMMTTFVLKMQFILITWDIQSTSVRTSNIHGKLLKHFIAMMCIIYNYIFSPINDVIKFLVFITLYTTGTS